ncbi:MAG: branched-chain amino acid aminotransferase [Candidatus Heimdallarchaeota archaeon]|nr:branched-chain amino acid aminotransferase [Candidatus Heimdallarchaeota archaeon]
MGFLLKIAKQVKKEAERGSLPEDESELGFAKIFTDHMFLMDYLDDSWRDPRIEPYLSLELDPAALVFHYAQEIFEGMKGFRQEDTEEISFFRPQENAKRFNKSAERMCMPTIPEDDFLESLHALVATDKHWVPYSSGTALYIRPTMIATEVGLGVRSANRFLFYIILSPVGPYFPEGFKPIKIFVEPYYVRAAEGGVGEAKTGGNYAASLYAKKKAKEHGCRAVLWLDAKEHKFIEEVGAMNQFFVIDDTIYTPPTTGTILQGVTRKSVIQLAKDKGYSVKEKKVDINTLIEAISNESCTEAFGSGTAASIAPVGELVYQDKNYVINKNKVGAITQDLYTHLTGIQYGRVDDPYGWNVPLKE